MDRKEREKINRREEMLNAAKDLLAKKGFSGLQIKEIAEKSEFSRITIYSYFKNKFDIISVLFYVEATHFFEEYQKNIKNMRTTKEKLMEFGWSYFQFFVKNKGLHQFVFHLESEENPYKKLSDPTIRQKEKFNRLARNILEEVFRDGIANREIREDLDISIAIAVFWKSVFAIIHSYIFHPNLDVKRLQQELEYLIRAFIAEGISE